MTGGEASESGFAWKVPLCAALAVLFTAGPLIWSRDFVSVLLFVMFYSPGLGGIGLLLLVLAIFARKPGTLRALLSFTFAAGAMFCAVLYTARPISIFLHNRVAFEIWYPTHHDLVAGYARQDAIVMTWADWGMAGSSNFSFLISDPDDVIGNSPDQATHWARRLKSDCEVTYVTRLRRGLYILDTFNCPLTDERTGK